MLPTRKSHPDQAKTSEPSQGVTPHPAPPATFPDASNASSELHNRVEIWVNEGGAGGEDNESM
jgi:hypothetical protein